MNALLAVLIAGVLAFIIWQYGLRLIYAYRITDKAIEIRLLNIATIKKISFADIIEVWPATFWDLMPFSNAKALGVVRWGNRLLGNIVILRLKHHMFNYVALTPDDRDAFVKILADQQANKNIVIHQDAKF
jgi:hypothetical protein